MSLINTHRQTCAIHICTWVFWYKETLFLNFSACLKNSLFFAASLRLFMWACQTCPPHFYTLSVPSKLCTHALHAGILPARLACCMKHAYKLTGLPALSCINKENACCRHEKVNACKGITQEHGRVWRCMQDVHAYDLKFIVHNLE